MSQQNVGNVINRLLTDEELRMRFALPAQLFHGIVKWQPFADARR